MDLERLRARVEQAIAPLQPATDEAINAFAFNPARTNAGRRLPAYYLVYFLLVDLLEFRNQGQFDKVAWSVLVEFEGRTFAIEHRKFGLGIFAADLKTDEPVAEEIANRLRKAAKLAEPYFDWRAGEAAKDSKLNVNNRAADLFARYEFLAGQYEAKRDEAERRKHEQTVTTHEHGQTYHSPASALRREARWLALSTIESFFSWTEHVFILVAILLGKALTGEQVKNLATADWETKFKAALDIKEPSNKRFYDELSAIRTQLRNFVAHGAFGKQGEAFQFHSGAGAVPMLMPYKQSGRFHFGHGVDFVADEAIGLLKDFVPHLWSGPREPAYVYVQDWALPVILTMAQNGQYAKAMRSKREMTELTEYQAALMDRHADMDF